MRVDTTLSHMPCQKKETYRIILAHSWLHKQRLKDRKNDIDDICIKRIQYRHFMNTLNNKVRNRFKSVDHLIRTNPFSDERIKANRALVGQDEVSSRSVAHSEVVKTLASLRESGQCHHADYSNEDAYLLQSAILFTCFHKVLHDMDALITAQQKTGDTCRPVPFASDLLTELQAFGFSQTDAVRYIGLFYQLRRAYHFIAGGLLGGSPCMRTLRCTLWEQVFTRNVRLYEHYLWERMEDFSVLLLGETGTGKGAAAAAIGRSGFIPFDPRKGQFRQSFTEAFVATNLSEFAESLLESEIFGHKRGAFTGATSDRQGILARCSRYGSVFLDEIGDVPMTVQIKLLRVMQERTFQPVGGQDALRFHGRVIAATNQSIDKLRRDGRIRDDFYYRLCSDRIKIPPLRVRIAESDDELPILLQHILKRLCGERGTELVDSVRQTIEKHLPRDYAWPGNVRELEQTVRRVLLRGDCAPDSTSMETVASSGLPAAVEAGTLDARELTAEYCAHLYAKLGTYGDVARRTGLDWRTVKKHITGTDKQDHRQLTTDY